jgi:putative phage-type endonuclease
VIGTPVRGVQFTDRAEWMAWRKGGIGASDVAGILGLSPWASPWSVWASKVGLTGEQEANEAMEAGHWLELAIGPWFAHKTGLHLAGQQLAVEHGTHSHHRATLDGLVYDDPPVSTEDAVPLGGAEFKSEAFGRQWTEIPPHYQCQAGWQMHVCDLERVWFAVLRGRTLDIHELVRDQADIDLMVDRVDAFWAEHVLTGTPPATDGHQATLDALAEVYPTGEPESTLALDDLAETVAEWKWAKAEVKAAEEAEAEAAAAIKAALGEHENGTVDGQLVVSWRTQSGSRLDTKALRAAEPELAERFTTTTETRVMRAHKPKGAPK